MSDGATAAGAFENWGVFNPEGLDRFCERKQSASEALVENFLNARTINVAVGDSGLGKTPLVLQLCICVASGRPFLGMRCRSGLVLYLGFEDGVWRVRETLQKLARHAGLSEIPSNLHVWLEEVGKPLPFSALIEVEAQLRPALIVIDPIRLMMPTIEDPRMAAERIKDLMELTHHGAAVLAIHHSRKSDRTGVPIAGLEDEGCRVNSWLECAAGSRAIINHSSTRIALDIPADKSQSDLVMKWNRRGHGDTGPMRLRKVLDPEDGDPLGWEALTGEGLLDERDRDRFLQLDREFRWKDVVAVCGGKSQDVPRQLINRAENLNLVLQTERGKWRKLAGALEGGEGGEVFGIRNLRR